MRNIRNNCELNFFRELGRLLYGKGKRDIKFKDECGWGFGRNFFIEWRVNGYIWEIVGVGIVKKLKYVLIIKNNIFFICYIIMELVFLYYFYFIDDRFGFWEFKIICNLFKL